MLIIAVDAGHTCLAHHRKWMYDKDGCEPFFIHE